MKYYVVAEVNVTNPSWVSKYKPRRYARIADSFDKVTIQVDR